MGRLSAAQSMILLTVVCAAVACMNLGPGTSPGTRYYLLTPETDRSLGPMKSALPPAATVGIGPVSLPAYLDRPQIVTRMTGNQIKVDEFHRWGEPLKDAIQRVIMENLFAGAGDLQVVAYPWKRSMSVDAQVAIEVLRFDADATGKVTLTARWQMIGADGNKLLDAQRVSYTRTTGPDHAQVVAAMSDALSAFSSDILGMISAATAP